MWAAHVKKWPDATIATGAVDRSQDPAGSWRGDGNQYLTPEQNALVNDMISDVKQAQPAITRDMEQIAQENTYGAWPEGLRFKLKEEEPLKKKAAGNLESAPDAPPEQAVRDIPDAIRYTFCAMPENYKDAYSDIKERLEARGYKMYGGKNSWSDDQYKGINTRWTTPEGQRFEVQFHTPESFHAKQAITHSSYERLRGSQIEKDERGELEAFQREVSSWIHVPDGVADIHIRKEGH